MSADLRVVSAVLDVSAVVLHRRPDPRLQQLLDHGHRLRVVLVVDQGTKFGLMILKESSGELMTTSWIAVSMDAAALESRKSGCPDE